MALARDDLQKRLADSGHIGLNDVAPLGRITAAQPIYQCNGCEVDIAGKAKADLVVTGLIDKISETHLVSPCSIVDVARSQRSSSMRPCWITGNTDEARGSTV